jgi:hypothetical protein
MSDPENEAEAAPMNTDALQANPVAPPNEIMGLKAIHIAFVVVSVASCVSFGVWGIRDYSQSHSGVHLGMGIASLVFSVVLAVYGRWFLRKLKGLSSV